MAFVVVVVVAIPNMQQGPHVQIFVVEIAIVVESVKTVAVAVTKNVVHIIVLVVQVWLGGEVDAKNVTQLVKVVQMVMQVVV